MSTASPRPLMRLHYENEAQAYLRSLPLEHFMESTPQATQRKITLESLDLVRARRSDFHLYNELLVQYQLGRSAEIRKVVPDNMVVLCDQRPHAISSYNVPLEPARPFWVLEYVSPSNPRKDYDDNFRKYEQELKVPYYLLFYPDTQDLSLFHLVKGKYVTVKPNARGRYPIRKLRIELAIRDEWVRYWYEGELLALPAELQFDLDESRRQLQQANRRADEANRRANEANRRADEQRQRAQALEEELARLRAGSQRPPNAGKHKGPAKG